MCERTRYNSMKLSGDSVVKLVMMAEDNPRESHWSLMMFHRDCSIRCCSSVVILTCNHVVLLCVVTSVVVLLTTRVMVLVICVTVVVVVLLLRRLPLTVLLVLHPSILKPDLHLPLR